MKLKNYFKLYYLKLISSTFYYFKYTQVLLHGNTGNTNKFNTNQTLGGNVKVFMNKTTNNKATIIKPGTFVQHVRF